LNAKADTIRIIQTENGLDFGALMSRNPGDYEEEGTSGSIFPISQSQIQMVDSQTTISNASKRLLLSK
jgi:hypothetical protein